MEIILVLVALMVVLDLASSRWGVDSRDDIAVNDWELRFPSGHL
jgi:hypothetical protein